MSNLLKMDRYQLCHNRVYLGGLLAVFLLGFFMADTYILEVMGPGGGKAASLEDIFNGMVYDSTFLLIIISSILALILGQEFSCRTINQEISSGHSRGEIFVSKVASYLIAFNVMAVIYPIAGCIREFVKIGIADTASFFYNVIKASAYSFILNSPVLLIAVLTCFYFESSAKAVAATAFVTFVLSLYLGYGMLLGLPVDFLPTYQIREAVSRNAFILLSGILDGIVWAAVLIIMSWRKFCKCDLK